jgi:uncharacterized membrane protein YgcG
MLADKLLDPSTGLLCFDTFNFKGLLGDVQLVNGVIQPYLNVNSRRYRFRVLNGGPSRFYELFLTESAQPDHGHPLLGDRQRRQPPAHAHTGHKLPPQRGRALRHHHRLQPGQEPDRQPHQSPLGEPPGADRRPGADLQRLRRWSGRLLSGVPHRSGGRRRHVNPATHPTFYQLPSVVTPRITRNFAFDRDNGQWTVHDKFASCNELRFTVKQNSVENWLISNPRNDWQHPIHVHFEEHQILSRSGNGGHRSSYSGSNYGGSYGNGCAFGGGGGGISTSRPNVPNVEVSRKDVTRLQGDKDVKLFFRFHDFAGDFPMHCHNIIHALGDVRRRGQACVDCGGQGLELISARSPSRAEARFHL